MLSIYNDSEYIKIIGIDPGTNGLGLSLIEVDNNEKKIYLKFVKTFFGDELRKKLKFLDEVHDPKFLKLLAHQQNLLDYFTDFKPDFVICESPFMGRFPAAFAALVEITNMIKQALFKHDQFNKVIFIDPSNVKKTIGVKGRSSDDKDLVKKALIANHDIINLTNYNLSLLDEHSIDSIAVAYYLSKEIIEDCN